MTGTSCAEDVAALWAERKRSPSSHRLMLFAVLISASAHLIFAVWYQPEPAKASQQFQPNKASLFISLSSPPKIIEPVEPEAVEPAEPVLPDTSTDVLPAAPIHEPAESTPPPEEQVPPALQELQAILRESSAMADNYHLSGEYQARIQKRSDDASGIFDPRLRKNLKDARQRRTGIASAATELTRRHGETVVTVSDGRCKTSDNGSNSLTRASYWYFTACDD